MERCLACEADSVGAAEHCLACAFAQPTARQLRGRRREAPKELSLAAGLKTAKGFQGRISAAKLRFKIA